MLLGYKYVPFLVTQRHASKSHPYGQSLVLQTHLIAIGENQAIAVSVGLAMELSKFHFNTIVRAASSEQLGSGHDADDFHFRTW